MDTVPLISIALQSAFFEHLHKLSHRWHLEKKIDDVMKIPDIGAAGLNSLISNIFFAILPTVADTSIGLIYLSVTFSGWMAQVVIVQVVIYLFTTWVIVEWRKKFTRRALAADLARKQRAADSLLNFETVKYFVNEAHEKEEYGSAYWKLKMEEENAILSGQLLDILQNSIITIATLAGSLLSAWMVWSNTLTTGDYFLFLAHSQQIQSHLRNFGGYYRYACNLRF